MASALREILEEALPDEFVSCTILHPLDEHIVVEAPSEHEVRKGLLTIKDKISSARRSVSS